jgi:hypothetical protein
MAGKTETAEQRKQRLAKALKANLARRKAQARSRKARADSAAGEQSAERCRN